MAIKKVRRAINETSKGNEFVSAVDPAPSIPDPRVEIAINFMRTNLQRKIRLLDLAGATNLSTFYFASLFKSGTGVPPGKYLARLRMEKAGGLLATSLLSVKQIMGEVGYNTKNHFARHFKKSFGMPPSEYRRKARLSMIAKRQGRNNKIG